SALKLHALVLYTQPLLKSGFAGQQDSSPRSHHAMPGQTSGAAQRPHYLPRSAFESRNSRHSAISEHLTARNVSDNFVNVSEHRVRLRPGAADCGQTPAAVFTGESSSSLTFKANISVEKGFWRNGILWLKPPWVESLSSV